MFGLPNIKSAKKRVLVHKARTMENKAARSALRTTLKKFDAAVVGGSRSEADDAYKAAARALDRAAARGLIHRNKAANKKSGMALSLNRMA